MTVLYINNPYTMSFQRASNNLKAMSVSPTDYLKEWQFLLKYEDKSKCLCGKSLKHCNIFINKLNGKEVILGEACLTLLRTTKKTRELPQDDNLDDDDVNVMEKMIREERGYSVGLMDKIISVFRFRLNIAYKSMSVWNVCSQIDNLINRIIDNLVFKEKLEVVKNEAYAKWIIRKDFCNDCYEKIGDFWVEHKRKCVNDVACSRIKDKICGRCQLNPYSPTMKLCGVVYTK